MNKLVIVGIFYDGYYDLWIDFIRLFKRFWPDCPYPVYIINNELEIKNEICNDITVLHAGNSAEYSKKVQVALEQINSEYFLLLLEDFFFGEKVNTKQLNNILSFIEREKLEYYSMPLKEFQNISNQKHYKNYANLYKIMPNEEYTISCQPAIWSKKFLQQCIGLGNYNAWIFEGIYIKSKKAHSIEFLEKCCIDNRNILNFHHGALQGSLIPDTYKYFKEINYDFFSKREILSEKQYNKHKLKIFIKKKIPLKVQKAAKKILHTKSIIEKYSDEINYQIYENSKNEIQ